MDDFGSSSSSAFDELATLAAQVVDVAGAVVVLGRNGRLEVVGRTGLGPEDLPALEPWWTEAIQSGEPFSARDPGTAGVAAWRWFTAVPLRLPSGGVAGALALVDRSPRRLTPRQRSALQTVAHQAVLHLELHRHASSLAQSHERNRATERALRESETFYQALVESLPMNIFRKNIRGEFTFVNGRFCATLGRPATDILGRTDHDFFPAELAVQYQADDRRVLETGEVFETTEENVTPDGHRHYFHVIKTPLLDASGNRIGTQAIFWDVTRERRALEDLAHERDLLRALLEYAPDVIYFKDASSRILRASRAFAEKVGVRDPAELVGRTDHDLFTREHADRARADEEHILATGEPIDNQTERETWSDGRVTWALTSKLPLRDQRGRVIGTFGISRDITDLKLAQEKLERAEAKYRSIVQNAVDGIFQTTPDGQYLEANLALARIYGFGSVDELVTQRTDLQRQLYVDPHRRKEFERLLQEHDQIENFESQVYRKDGEVIWISENARAVRDDQGRLLYYEGTVEDITERKKAQAAIAAARDVALESARAKAQFLAIMSHELRTPMNGVLGMTRLLLDTPLTAEQRDYAEIQKSSAEALLTILNDILDFSKIESGKVEFAHQEFDLREMLEDTAELLAERAYAKQLEFADWIDARLPFRVRGDKGRLRQVLTNLLGNAIKFTLEGEVLLRVEVTAEADRLVDLRFEVRDTGIGIPESAQSRIFEAFTQADESMTRRFGGTGLGLAISRQIVERMGGQIGFTSIEGRGSTFWFTARLERVPHPFERRPTLPEGARVLVAEDHPATRDSLVHELQLAGAQVVATGTAAEALGALKDSVVEGRLFAAALLDLQLPDMDALTLAHEIHLQPGLEGERIILMAPLGQRMDPGLLRAVGVSAHLVKPVKRDRLVELLQGVMAGADTIHLAQIRQPAPTAAAQGAPRLRLLLAEDNVVNQKVALHVLRKLDLTADVAAHGLQVLEAVKRQHYDVILMDCQMPELDGYETTRRLRREEADGAYGPRAPHYVVALTANAMAGDREKCLAAGMDDFLTKPMDTEALRLALQRAVAFRREAEALATAMSGSPVIELSAGDQEPNRVSAVSSSADALPVLETAALDGLRVPEDPAALGELVDLFLADAPQRLRTLIEACGGRDSTTARVAAHTLKGSASNLGARRLAARAAEAETAARAGDWETLNQLLPVLEHCLAEARPGFEAAKNG